MKKRTSMLRWAIASALVCIAFASFALAAQGKAETKKAMVPGRADVLSINAMAAEAPLELPAVTFKHDQHTLALAAQKKDCSSCHEPLKGTEGKYSFTLKGTEKLSGEALKNAFHANCIGCHTAMGKDGKATGPLEAACRSCHNPRPDTASSWQDIGFDKLLHAKHVNAKAIAPVGDPERNCGACHHAYDPASKKVTWVKDKEDSCRACHMQPAVKSATLKQNKDATDANGSLAKRLTLPEAGHAACVNCHLGVTAKDAKAKSGPVDCMGCHDAGMQKKLAQNRAESAKTTQPSRLFRGQPDAALLLPEAPAKDAPVKSTMSPVAFNHKIHEDVAQDCRTCHHKKIAACSDCHTVGGKAEGNFVPLTSAMHKTSSNRSCVGCHTAATTKPECAGCHASIPQGPNKSSCQSCHSVPIGVSPTEAEDGSLLNSSKERKSDIAKLTVAARVDAKVTTFDLADIPEQVTISTLSKEYEPSVFPHRKIVKTLVEKQANNRLAGVFHSDKAMVCQGCHHNTPASKTPPRCVSCHKVETLSAQSDRPALKAAYHLQCMGCHEQMGQKPAATECKDCHKPRKN